MVKGDVMDLRRDFHKTTAYVVRPDPMQKVNAFMLVHCTESGDWFVYVVKIRKHHATGTAIQQIHLKVIKGTLMDAKKYCKDYGK